MHAGSSRSGLSLIELLVALSLGGLLVALTLPAVAKVREASRRVRCQNNLRQLGLALHEYESVNGMFPAAKQAEPGYPINPKLSIDGMRDYSVHAYLLPYLGHSPLYASLNFSLPVPNYWELGSSALPGWSANVTSLNSAVGVFLCPSDSYAQSVAPGRNSYRANVGTGLCGDSPGCGIADGNGAFVHGRNLRVRDFADGLSKTVALSEKLCGVGTGSFRSERDFVYTNAVPNCTIISADWIVDRCRELKTPPSNYYAHSGYTWAIGDTRWTSYTHAATPNSTSVDCAIRGAKPPCGAFGARSLHERGVNVMLADGAVRFISESISLSIWRSLGTRNLGDGPTDDGF